MLHIWELWIIHSSSDYRIHMVKDEASELEEEIEKVSRPSIHPFVGQLETHIKSARASIKSMNGWLFSIGILYQLLGS